MICVGQTDEANKNVCFPFFDGANKYNLSLAMPPKIHFQVSSTFTDFHKTEDFLNWKICYENFEYINSNFLQLNV